MKRHITTLLMAVVLTATALSANVVGGDISLLTRYEQNGANYKDKNGQRITDMLTFLHEQGLNAMRVRLFVDPSKASTDDKGQGVCQDLDYVVALGARIKAAGFKLMLDFHYSDSWADPVKQYTPDSWKSLSEEELPNKIYEYTRDCLKAMVAAGATPDYIQTGNEISYGMLWGPVGTSSGQLKKLNVSDAASVTRFVNLLNHASQACREVCPRAKIVIHTELVRNISLLNSYYKAVAPVDYDIVGLSYYPYYHYGFNQLTSAITNVMNNSSCDGKEIMIVETGYYHKWQPDNINYDYSATYPITNEGQRAFTADMIKQLLNYPRVTGLFWWWPEANEYGLNWATKRVTDSWYNAGLWDNETGRALPALYELAAFAPAIAGDVDGNGSVGIEDVNEVINVMLGKAENALADVDGGGSVGIEDVNAVINIMLGK
ncbi:MAG: glycosyl hydrolase 53 family protein [Muribaculaceae bacterium]|nr:glycosyl hydrolase 53 family protein [Muribaculaceae bacterium]